MFEMEKVVKYFPGTLKMLPDDGVGEHEKVVKYFPGTKKIQSKKYFLNGEFHNKNGPASITYYESGKAYRECYYHHGKIHNENGPAIIFYYEDGSLKKQQYYLNGKLYSDILQYMVTVATC